MKATFLDLRRRTKEILSALDRDEAVTLKYRGKEKAVITPVRPKRLRLEELMKHPAFGMWRDRRDLENVDDFVRKLRRGRFHAV